MLYGQACPRQEAHQAELDKRLDHIDQKRRALDQSTAALRDLGTRLPAFVEQLDAARLEPTSTQDPSSGRVRFTTRGAAELVKSDLAALLVQIGFVLEGAAFAVLAGETDPDRARAWTPEELEKMQEERLQQLDSAPGGGYTEEDHAPGVEPRDSGSDDDD